MDHCLVHPSSETLPPEANGSKYRDTQPDNMQKMKDLATLSPKWDIPIKYYPIPRTQITL